MASRIENAETYDVKKDDLFFIDANIWITMIYETLHKRFKAYQKLFFNILEKNAKIMLNELVVSEIVNRIIKLRYNDYIKKNQLASDEYTLKEHFRGSEPYKKVIESIYAQLSSLKSCIECYSSAIKIEEILEFFDTENEHAVNMDFNDFVYAKLSEKNKLILVSEDLDMMSANDRVKILTTNKRYVN